MHGPEVVSHARAQASTTHGFEEDSVKEKVCRDRSSLAFAIINACFPLALMLPLDVRNFSSNLRVRLQCEERVGYAPGMGTSRSCGKRPQSLRVSLPPSCFCLPGPAFAAIHRSVPTDSVRSQLRAVWAGETSEECLVAANPSVNEGGHRGEAETGSWQKLKGELIRSGSAWNFLGYATNIARQVCGLNS